MNWKKNKRRKEQSNPFDPPNTNKHNITNKSASFTHTTVGHHCFEQRVLWSGLRVNLGQLRWPSPIILSLHWLRQENKFSWYQMPSVMLNTYYLIVHGRKWSYLFKVDSIFHLLIVNIIAFFEFMRKRDINCKQKNVVSK